MDKDVMNHKTILTTKTWDLLKNTTPIIPKIIKSLSNINTWQIIKIKYLTTMDLYTNFVYKSIYKIHLNRRIKGNTYRK